jgi:outer membrane immunogenic protein
MKAFVVAGAALLASVATAMSADMAVKTQYAPAPYNWTGCYIGAQVGYAAQRDSANESNALSLRVATTPVNSANPDGIKVGGFIGCNYQFAGPWVIGIEGDGEWADISGSTRFNDALGSFYDSRTRAQGSARVRLGYAIDRVFFYGTGGGAAADIQHTYVTLPGGATSTLSDVGIGLTGGFGVEYAFAGNWLARLEYRYADFDEIKHLPASRPGLTDRHHVTENAVRFGLGVKFGGQ